MKNEKLIVVGVEFIPRFLSGASVVIVGRDKR